MCSRPRFILRLTRVPPPMFCGDEGEVNDHSVRGDILDGDSLHVLHIDSVSVPRVGHSLT